MPTRGAGLSFKLASAAFVMTEIAPWLEDLGADASSDELAAATFNPGASIPTRSVYYGQVTRSMTLTGQWSSTVETFFNAIQGFVDWPYQQSPEGTATGKTLIYGSCNIGPWSGPIQSSTGLITFSIPLTLNTRNVKTWITPPATIAITSSSVADPTVITSAAHGLVAGDVITIAGHTGSTPTINGTHAVKEVLSSTTFTIPVNVTVGGTGGTIQKY